MSLHIFYAPYSLSLSLCILFGRKFRANILTMCPIVLLVQVWRKGHVVDIQQQLHKLLLPPVLQQLLLLPNLKTTKNKTTVLLTVALDMDMGEREKEEECNCKNAQKWKKKANGYPGL